MGEREEALRLEGVARARAEEALRAITEAFSKEQVLSPLVASQRARER